MYMSVSLTLRPVGEKTDRLVPTEWGSSPRTHTLFLSNPDGWSVLKTDSQPTGSESFHLFTACWVWNTYTHSQTQQQGREKNTFHLISCGFLFLRVFFPSFTLRLSQILHDDDENENLSIKHVWDVLSILFNYLCLIYEESLSISPRAGRVV